MGVGFGLADGQCHGHAAVAMHFGLGKNAQVRAGSGQSSGHIGELGLTVAGHHNRMACRHRAGRNRERHMARG